LSKPTSIVIVGIGTPVIIVVIIPWVGVIIGTIPPVIGVPSATVVGIIPGVRSATGVVPIRIIAPAIIDVIAEMPSINRIPDSYKRWPVTVVHTRVKVVIAKSVIGRAVVVITVVVAPTGVIATGVAL
jgi:hypothetical protein